MFNLILGVVLIAGSVLLCVTGVRRARAGRLEAPGHAGGAVPVEIAAAGARRRVGLGAAISVGVGFLSSLLGIGGGIIHVPAMIMVLGFPVHIATATSHFVLGITAAVGTGVHAANGALDNGWAQTLALGAGVVVGAQAGARLSRRTRPLVIVLGLAIALGLVGVRIVAKAMGV
jgi:hypothetical protein